MDSSSRPWPETSSLDWPKTSTGNSTLSIVVRQGNITACWNIIPMSRLGPDTVLPSNVTDP
jgi:hypothetical protein